MLELKKDVTAKVKIFSFSPVTDKIRILATIPIGKEGREIEKEFEKLKSWKIIHSSLPRIDLESTLPIRKYEILVNPLGRSDREYESGEDSEKMAFWLNSRDGTPVYSFGDSLECNKGGKSLPCFELRNEYMMCNFHDQTIIDMDGDSFPYGKAKIICNTNKDL